MLFAIITVQKTPIREETYVLKKNTMYRKIHRLNMQYICSCTKKLSCFYAVVISQKKTLRGLLFVFVLFLCCTMAETTNFCPKNIKPFLLQMSEILLKIPIKVFF